MHVANENREFIQTFENVFLLDTHNLLYDGFSQITLYNRNIYISIRYIIKFFNS